MRVAIDVGHLSTTPGKRTPPIPFDIDINSDGIVDLYKGQQYREHYASVGVAVELDAALLRCGFETVKVAWDDADASDDETMEDLGERQRYIRAQNCDYSISLHWDAYGDGSTFNSINGFSIYVHSDPTRARNSLGLAQSIRQYLGQGTPQTDRGIRYDEFAMCNAYVMNTQASLLLELGFMTNLHEATNMMMNSNFWKEAAEEICKGICAYSGIPYVEGDDDMLTQEQFNQMMDIYLAQRANLAPESWSEDSRQWAEETELILGDENGNKQYQSFCTREQMVVFMQRLANILGNFKMDNKEQTCSLNNKKITKCLLRLLYKVL